MKVCILALEYLEPDWQKTKACLLRTAERTGATIHWIDREGVGSMAEAYNRGFRESNAKDFNYAWFVSNVVFPFDCLERLVTAIGDSGFAAVHPAFDSDHWHTQPLWTNELLPAPFLEFTSPLVRSSIFEQIQLDEGFPYWAHDLDWGYRVRNAGHKIGVYHGSKVDHCYIRNNKAPNPITAKRLENRRATDAATKERLIKLYGPDWRNVLSLYKW